MAHDRPEGDEFPMTYEYLSMMMGDRRAGVTVAAGALQRAGLIRYERGRVEVTDRPGLEAAACECYGVVRRAYDRLLDGPPSPGGRAGASTAAEAASAAATTSMEERAPRAALAMVRNRTAKRRRPG